MPEDPLAVDQHMQEPGYDKAEEERRCDLDGHPPELGSEVREQFAPPI